MEASSRDALRIPKLPDHPNIADYHALSSWSDLRLNCTIFQHNVHSAFGIHLRALADVCLRVLDSEVARCSPLPSDKGSLFQAGDLLPSIQNTLILFDRVNF